MIIHPIVHLKSIILNPFQIYQFTLGIFSVNYECSTIPHVEGNFSTPESVTPFENQAKPRFQK